MQVLPRLSQSLQHEDRPLNTSITSRLNFLQKESERKKQAVKAYELKLAEAGVDLENEE